jgi:hypothetical protein
MIDKRQISNSSAEPPRPIEFLTENGFSIIRLCEIDGSIPASGTTHQFLVRDPHGYELQIDVDIAKGATEQIIGRSRGCLTSRSSYWIACAERHLAAYLSENDDYPPAEKLTVTQVSLDDLDLALRCESSSNEDKNWS